MFPWLRRGNKDAAKTEPVRAVDDIAEAGVGTPFTSMNDGGPFTLSPLTTDDKGHIVMREEEKKKDDTPKEEKWWEKERMTNVFGFPVTERTDGYLHEMCGTFFTGVDMPPLMESRYDEERLIPGTDAVLQYTFTFTEKEFRYIAVGLDALKQLYEAELVQGNQVHITIVPKVSRKKLEDMLYFVLNMIEKHGMRFKEDEEIK